MTCLEKEKVQIHRQKKVKLAGEFRFKYEPHLDLEGDVIKNGDPSKKMLVFPGFADIAVGDRVVNDAGVYVITNVQRHQPPTADETVAACELDDFETGWEALKGLGCDLQFGVVESIIKDDDAERFMDAWVGTFVTNITDHLDGLRNGRDISPFYGLFNHDIPVACVGAGPSLDRNVDLLHKFPGLIICADRAYKMLRARGIEPDFVVTVDCHYDLVAEMLTCPGSDRHKLIANVCADPKIWKVWKGPIFSFLMRHPGVQFTDKILPALFPKFHSIDNAGCVGNTSVLFSDYVGLSPVVLVGQDFSYTDGKMHAQRFDIREDGSVVEVEDDHAALLDKRTGKIEIDGVMTYLPFRGFRDTTYALARNRSINIINCTEGGILNALPKKPLAQMIDELAVSSNGKYVEARRLIKSI